MCLLFKSCLAAVVNSGVCCGLNLDCLVTLWDGVMEVIGVPQSESSV